MSKNINHLFDEFVVLDEAFGSIVDNDPRQDGTPIDGLPSVDAPGHLAGGLEYTQGIERLNGFLASVSRTPAINPYYILNRIQTKLMEVGINFKDGADHIAFKGEMGEHMIPLVQFGGRFGRLDMHDPDLKSDDGISHRLGHSLALRLVWICLHGLFTIDALLVPMNADTENLAEQK